MTKWKHSVLGIVLLTVVTWVAVAENRVVGPPPYARAEVFYFGWDVLTRGTLTPQEVRDNPRTSILIHDATYASIFAK